MSGEPSRRVFTVALDAAMAALGWGGQHSRAGVASDAAPSAGSRFVVSISLQVAAAGASMQGTVPRHLSLDLTLDLGTAALDVAWRRLMGRPAKSGELSAMGGDVAAELVNQLAGRLAGELGKAGLLVELATPRGIAAPPASAWLTLCREHAGERLVAFLSPTESA